MVLKINKALKRRDHKHAAIEKKEGKPSKRFVACPKDLWHVVFSVLSPLNTKTSVKQTGRGAGDDKEEWEKNREEH